METQTQVIDGQVVETITTTTDLTSYAEDIKSQIQSQQMILSNATQQANDASNKLQALLEKLINLT